MENTTATQTKQSEAVVILLNGKNEVNRYADMGAALAALPERHARAFVYIDDTFGADQAEQAQEIGRKGRKPVLGVHEKKGMKVGDVINAIVMSDLRDSGAGGKYVLIRRRLMRIVGFEGVGTSRNPEAVHNDRTDNFARVVEVAE